MSTIAAKINFRDFPPELRMMAIDKMEPEDRGRFSASSKSCNIEAKASKNYIHGMVYDPVSNYRIRLTVFFFERNFRFEGGRSIYCSYDLDFLSTSGNKYMRCRLDDEAPDLWRVELDKKTDLVRYSLEYFTKMLLKYQRTIKSVFYVGSYRFSDVNFGIKSLAKLDSLYIDRCRDIDQFILKTWKPLVNLHVDDWKSDKCLADYEQIYQVTEKIYLPDLKLNNEQFLRLPATIIIIHIGMLTEIDIFNFIRSWQNGTLRPSFRFCHWILDSNFSLMRVCRLLGVGDYGFEDGGIGIRHRKEAGKCGTLEFYGVSLDFHGEDLFNMSQHCSVFAE